MQEEKWNIYFIESVESDHQLLKNALNRRQN